MGGAGILGDYDGKTYFCSGTQKLGSLPDTSEAWILRLDFSVFLYRRGTSEKYLEINLNDVLST